MRCASTVIAELAQRPSRREGGPTGGGLWTLRRAGGWFALMALAMLGGACEKFRGLEGELPPCQDYQTAIQPLLNERCVSCHGADRADGDYRLTSRLEALARRDDGSTRVVGADGGGGDSLVLAAVRGELPGHVALVADEQEALRAWVVDCRAGGRRLYFHPRGWSTPTTEVFHGTKLRGTGYQLDGGTFNCMGCHGEDLAGGKAEVTCHECHGATLFACNQCHGSTTNAAPPKALSGSSLTSAPGVGAHQTHVRDGALHVGYDCSKCHIKPVDPFESGHFQVDGGPEDGRAEVVFAYDGGRGSYSLSELTCTGTSCHAPLEDATAKNQRPTWNKVGQKEAECGSCHGVPPPNHSTEQECGICHKGAYADGGVVVAMHANGTVNVGLEGDAKLLTCTSCHGDAVAFRDVHESTDPTVVTVGAHQAHLSAKHRISAPILCSQCHRMPTEVRSPGHIDQPRPAVVFPSFQPDSGTIAWNDNAVPQWDRTTKTCTNVYCHGLGNRGALDTSPSKLSQVGWTLGDSQLFCGSCHGVPPNTVVHAGAVGLTSCSGCHEETVNAQGGLNVTRLPDGGVVTTHINGVLNLGRLPDAGG